MLEWLLSTKQVITSVREDVEKRNPHSLLVGMETGAAIMETSIAGSQKIKNRVTI